MHPILHSNLHTGMLENDLLLGTFADKYLDLLSPEQVEEYYELLQQPDPGIKIA